MAKAGYSHCQAARCHHQLLRKDGSMSAVALGVGFDSLTHRGWHPKSTVCALSTATAKLHNAALHKVQVQSVASSLCVPTPLRALRVYAAGVMQNCLRWSGRQPPALPSRFASCVQSSVALVVCWHLDISQALCALFWSAALPCMLCLPPPTLGACLLRSIARAVCPSAPQGGSLRTALRHSAVGDGLH